ncbi:MAG TPA: hypothetical protein VF529_00900 [Solirubrobacteraceae bacterium]|jgi:hypothetical protein
MRRRWRELSFEKQLSIVIMPIILAVLGVVLPMLLLGGADHPDPPPPRTASLSVPEVVVSNPELELRFPDPETDDAEPTKATLPRAELTVHNVGTRRSIVRRARFHIRRHVHIPICATAGELGIARKYGIALPPDPALGTVVESVPLRRQLAPDEAEVLRFRFTIDERVPSGDHLYEIAISILHDASSQPQPAGTVLLSLPGAPDDGQLWTTPAEEAERGTQGFPPPIIACWKRNSQRLLTFLKNARGVRSPELEAIPRRLRIGPET